MSLSEMPLFTVPPTRQVNEKLAKDLPAFMVPTSLVSKISQIDSYMQPYTHMFSCLWMLGGIPGECPITRLIYHPTPHRKTSRETKPHCAFTPPGLRQKKQSLEKGVPRGRSPAMSTAEGQGLSDHQMAGSLALGACLYILLGDRLATG